jgi:hypothetical protein
MRNNVTIADNTNSWKVDRRVASNETADTGNLIVCPIFQPRVQHPSCELK